MNCTYICQPDLIAFTCSFVFSYAPLFVHLIIIEMTVHGARLIQESTTPELPAGLHIQVGTTGIYGWWCFTARCDWRHHYVSLVTAAAEWLRFVAAGGALTGRRDAATRGAAVLRAKSARTRITIVRASTHRRTKLHSLYGWWMWQYFQSCLGVKTYLYSGQVSKRSQPTYISFILFNSACLLLCLTLSLSVLYNNTHPLLIARVTFVNGVP